MMEYGGLYVAQDGIDLMQLLCVDNWVSLVQVLCTMHNMYVTIHVYDYDYMLCTPTVSVGALPRLNALFGRGEGPILQSDTGCNGIESRLLDCPASTLVASCSHQNDAGVVCQLGTLTSSSYCLFHKNY